MPMSVTVVTATEKLFRMTERLLSAHADHLSGGWCIAATELVLMLSRLIMNSDVVPEHLKI